MSQNFDLEEVDFQELPHHLALNILKYGGAMIGISRTARKADHQGSCTFVKSQGRHYILTAAHCADALQEYEEMGLAISNKEDGTTHPIPKPIYVVRRWSRFGPDLAFLPLSLEIVEFISRNSNKEFYDLDKHRDDILKDEPRPRFGLWVLTGSPILLCDLERDRRKEFKFLGFSNEIGLARLQAEAV